MSSRTDPAIARDVHGRVWIQWRDEGGPMTFVGISGHWKHPPSWRAVRDRARLEELERICAAWTGA